MNFASLVYDETGNTAIIRFTYDKVLVDRLKVIPPGFRNYDPETKAWSVQAPYDKLAADLLLQHFPGATVQDRPQPRSGFGGTAYTPPSCGCTPDHKLLGVCAGANEDLVKAALRIAAKKSHPDVGGSTKQMQAINAAADRLLQEAR